MNKSLKYIRIILAALMLLGITALLLDTTGLVRQWMGWAPKVQLLPAVLALNVPIVSGSVKEMSAAVPVRQLRAGCRPSYASASVLAVGAAISRPPTTYPHKTAGRS